MHRIIVIPFTAPNESVIFEYLDDFLGHAILIGDLAGVRLPEPIIGESQIEVDGNAVRVRARLAGIRYGPAIVGAGDRVCGMFDVVGPRVDFRRHSTQVLVHSIDRRDLDLFIPCLGQPDDVGKPRRHLTVLAIAVHLCEERRIAHASRIGIYSRRRFQPATRIRDTELIDDGRVVQKLSQLFSLSSDTGMIVPSRQYSPLPWCPASLSG